MLLKKLNIFIEQVATYLKEENKLSSSSSSASSSEGSTTTECIEGGCDVGGNGMTTNSVMGPDSPETSIANTYKAPPPHEKGQAGIDSNDIKPMMVPAIPYKKVTKRRKRKINQSLIK